MAIIDPKTSKRFVNGMLKSESLRLDGCVNELHDKHLTALKTNKR